MSPRAKGIVPIAIVVCASVSALLFKGTTEWLVDLFVSACGGLACRLKASGPKAEAGRSRSDRARRPGRTLPRNSRHRAARSGTRKPRAHRPARVRLGLGLDRPSPEERWAISRGTTGPARVVDPIDQPGPEAAEAGVGV